MKYGGLALERGKWGVLLMCLGVTKKTREEEREEKK